MLCHGDGRVMHSRATNNSREPCVTLRLLSVEGANRYFLVIRFMLQAVVFSEGELSMDNCDFSKSWAPTLVFSNSVSKTTVRNTLLGDNNCEFASWWWTATFSWNQ